jgi:hypothetical protein
MFKAMLIIIALCIIAAFAGLEPDPDPDEPTPKNEKKKIKKKKLTTLS